MLYCNGGGQELLSALGVFIVYIALALVTVSKKLLKQHSVRKVNNGRFEPSNRSNEDPSTVFTFILRIIYILTWNSFKLGTTPTKSNIWIISR